MIRVFIGYDKRESVAAYVLMHSIMSNASEPVNFTMLNRPHLDWFYHRSRGPLDSTDFSLTRFLVPHLCDYRGHAIFMDCDMLVRSDITHLWSLRDEQYALRVVKHDYVPAKLKKFLDQKQTRYPRKNWSSVMLFDCSQCTVLTPQYVEKASGLDLQQLAWLPDEKIGSLPKEWNYLVGEENQCKPEEARLIHYTNGTPCFEEYANCEFSRDWEHAFDQMTTCG